MCFFVWTDLSPLSIILLSPVERLSESGEKYALWNQAPFTSENSPKSYKKIMPVCFDIADVEHLAFIHITFNNFFLKGSEASSNRLCSSYSDSTQFLDAPMDIMANLIIKHIDIFVKSSFTIIESYGLLWCFHQLSFWRHPFIAEDPLVSKWCNNKFSQICSDEEPHFIVLFLTRKAEKQKY